MTRKLLLPAVAALLLVCGLVALGLWQLERKAWKEALIARVEQRAKAPPIPLADIPASWRTLAGAEAADFSPVTATGRFDHAREMHLLSPQRQGAFWMIVTRFDTPQGAVLALRGLVPDALKDPAKRPRGQVEGEITITGRIRAAEPRGAFTPADDVSRNHWFARDLAAMQRAAGINEASRALPFFIEVESPVPPGGLPRPQLDAINLRNDHLQYALTWFALAAVTVAMFGIWVRARRRED